MHREQGSSSLFDRRVGMALSSKIPYQETLSP